MKRGATLSEDRIYRYSLWRIWDESKSPVVFIGLNPSTADETVDDPTIRRCINFAKSWGHGGIYMLNLFALRATNPKELYTHAAPIGPHSDSELKKRPTLLTIACWGVNGVFRKRDWHVTEMLRSNGVELMCLGKTKDGHPRHPLYLRKEAELTRF